MTDQVKVHHRPHVHFWCKLVDHIVAALLSLDIHGEINSEDLESLDGFCMPDDKALLQELILQLVAWVQNSRKIFFETKSNEVKINDVQKEKADKQAMSAELIALAEKTKQNFRILKEIAEVCGYSAGGVRTTAPRDIIVGAAPEVHTPQLQVEMQHANGNRVNCKADTVTALKGDTDTCIQRISMDLKNLETMRSEYQLSLRDTQAEVRTQILNSAFNLELYGPYLPRPRPVYIGQEDIDSTLWKVFQFEAIPMIVTTSRDIRDRITDDNTSAVKLYETLEFPLRTISMVLKAYKISGSPLELDNRPLSPMYY
ncbi:hypothetical protein HYPSUDRAFT_1080522 [Hypholoma sublateritium FD-334 SS-4]|uniref:Uncharacterized protein n=1 Tax=Hypholoma sublateritium (strain FD-334 SS-4) TaxID=945553 RepID=A0A0D2L8S9_HYPSF|nr:hypothetical protein HYPSUDRAFT_1080522 [Hypholoma sublateritium FD-334 SS-4]